MRENNSGRPEKSHGGRIPAKWLISGLLLFAALAATAAWAVFGRHDQSRAEPGDDADDAGVVWELPEKTIDSGSVRSVLLAELDDPPEDGGSGTDDLVLCSLNRDKDAVALVSFLANTWVPIPGHGDDCVGRVWDLGGPELLKETLEQDLGLSICGCLAAGPEEIGRLAAIATPLELELTAEEAQSLNEQGGWALTEGSCLLDSGQLLAYVKKEDSAFHQARRRQQAFAAAYEKLSGLPVTELYTMAERELPQIVSDLSSTQVLELLFTAVSRRVGSWECLQFPAEGTYTREIIGGAEVLVPDLKENSRLLRQYLYDK